ncbi:MAG: 2-phospho-L-lactate guanylyltransferase [Methylobacteriaceae bacterium]|nr:2-phospho-L-lactate guanylyltransferase [Methylobacteriaceae bacterium]
MKKQPRIWAVVPVKSFARAKARLAPLLDAPQREQLARAMLEDVLTALQKLDALDNILVVSRDAGAGEIAIAHGASTLDDPFENGPNAAIRLAVPVLREAGVDAMIVVPADVPQTEADELLPILDALRCASVALVPAVRDGGTNLLGCAPVDMIEPCFGPDSFAQHMSAAKRAGIEPRVFACTSLSRDIDRPDDILEFRADRETRAGAYLHRALTNSNLAACAQ